MVICCGSKDSKLDKIEREDIIHLLKKTETRVEFYSKLQELSQYNYSMTRTKTNQILEILKDIILKEKKYQDKFYSIAYLHMILKKYEKARERFASNPLMYIILDSLRQESQSMREYLNVDKIKLWKERYVIICIELMCSTIKEDKNAFYKFGDFLINNNISVNREPFYTKITYPLILDVRTDAGKLIRRKVS